MNDWIYLEHCVKLIEEKLGWGSKDNWSHRDFIRLSEVIQSSTHISISTDTLKRVFGKVKASRETYNPQVGTKNAFAVFLGYKNWYEFRESQKAVMHEEEPNPAGKNAFVRARVHKKSYLLALAFIVLTALIIYSFNRWESTAKVIFQCKTPKGTAPHTAIFKYTIATTQQDTVYIDYDWDYTKLEPVSLRDSIITTYHVKPGFYRVKLRTGNQVLAEEAVHVLTEGWQGYLKFNGNEQKLKCGLFENGALYLNDTEFRKYGIKPDSIVWLNYYNFREFEADGDNFTLESRIKNSEEEGGQPCFDTEFVIVCEQGLIHLSLVQKGCHKYARFYVSDVKLDGNNNDLSPLGVDLADWRKVEIKTKNKALILSVDGKPLLKKEYNKNLGPIKGVKCHFKGRGKMDYLSILNKSGVEVYNDQFEPVDLRRNKRL